MPESPSRPANPAAPNRPAGPRGVELRLLHCGNRELRGANFDDFSSSDAEESDSPLYARYGTAAWTPSALPAHDADVAGGTGAAVEIRMSTQGGLTPQRYSSAAVMDDSVCSASGVVHPPPALLISPSTNAAQAKPLRARGGQLLGSEPPSSRSAPFTSQTPRTAGGKPTPSSTSTAGGGAGRRVLGAVWASATVHGLTGTDVTVDEVDTIGVVAVVNRIAGTAVDVAERLGLTTQPDTRFARPTAGPTLAAVLLRILDVPGCSLGDQGFAALIDALSVDRRKYAYLERLDVRFNAITDDGAEAVSALVHLIDAELVAEKQRRIAAETARVMKRQEAGGGGLFGGGGGSLAKRAAALGRPPANTNSTDGGGGGGGVRRAQRGLSIEEPPSLLKESSIAGPSGRGVAMGMTPTAMLARRKSLGMSLADSCRETAEAPFTPAAAVPGTPAAANGGNATSPPLISPRRRSTLKVNPPGEASGRLSPTQLLLSPGRRASVAALSPMAASGRGRSPPDSSSEPSASRRRSSAARSDSDDGAKSANNKDGDTGTGGAAAAGSAWERARNKLLAPRRGTGVRRIADGGLEPTDEEPFFSNLVLPSLRFIDLGDNDITDAGAGNVAGALLSCATVHISLGFDGNDISPAVDGGSTMLVSQSRAYDMAGTGSAASGAW